MHFIPSASSSYKNINLQDVDGRSRIWNGFAWMTNANCKAYNSSGYLTDLAKKP